MKKIKGPLYMVMTALFFSLIATVSKSLSRIPLTEKLFISSFIGFSIILIINIINKEKILGNKKSILFLRGILGVFGLLLYHYSISSMDLSDATVLYKMTPIFVLIISTIIFKEKVRKYLVISIVLVFIGTILVVKPTLSSNLLPAAASILASIITALAYMTVSYLKKSEKPTTVVLYYVLCPAIFMLPGIGTGTWVNPTRIEFILLILMALFTLLSQLFINLSYRESAVNDVTIYLYTEILFSFLIGAIIFKEGFDLLSILGAIIIVISVTVIAPKSSKPELDQAGNS